MFVLVCVHPQLGPKCFNELVLAQVLRQYPGTAPGSSSSPLARCLAPTNKETVQVQGPAIHHRPQYVYVYVRTYMLIYVYIYIY